MGNLDIEIEPLSNKDIIFGIMDCKRDLFVNHILLIAKNIFIPVDVIKPNHPL